MTMTTKATSSSRSTPFQISHLVTYGLEITERDPNTREITSVRCKFCIFSGREEKLGHKRMRRQTTVLMTWKPPYRAEKYRNHHEAQHMAAWTAYKALTIVEQQVYFDDKMHYKNTLHHAFGPIQTPLIFKVDALIVESIIGNLFFHPDDHGGISQTNALKLFKPNIGNSYTVTLMNPLQFRLAVDQIAIGLSFRQVAAVLISLKHHTGLILFQFTKLINRSSSSWLC